jgi:uncharacterized membrane protein YvbJ
MYCPSCGREISDSAVFCDKCGRQLSELAPQEGGQYRPAMRERIPDVPSHLGWAIAGLILFWPVGIAAIVNATRVDNWLLRGDVARAEEASRKAKKFGKICVWVSVVLFVVYLGTIIGLGATGSYQ